MMMSHSRRQIEAECIAAGQRFKADAGRVPTIKECAAIAAAVYARHGLDEDGGPLPETPDEQRDREETEELTFLRETDSHR